MSKTIFLQAQWRRLVMMNYAVNPEMLLPYLPNHTQLDIWQDTCYVSLVGFMFLDTRVRGIKIPFHINFEEVNLRFYVRYNDPEAGPKRGVVFIEEIVPKPAIAWVANGLYREHYVAVPMRHSWEVNNEELYISYGMKKQNQWFDFGVTAQNNPQKLIPGSEPEFITEHYWGYAVWDQNTTNEYEVAHPAWVTYPVTSYHCEVDFEKVYGAPFASLNNTPPVSVFLAEGSEIQVMKGAVIK